MREFPLSRGTSTGWLVSGRSGGRRSAGAVQPVLDLLRVEGEGVPPFDVGDAAFCPRAPDLAALPPEPVRHRLDVPKRAIATPAPGVAVRLRIHVLLLVC